MSDASEPPVPHSSAGPSEKPVNTDVPSSSLALPDANGHNSHQHNTQPPGAPLPTNPSASPSESPPPDRAHPVSKLALIPDADQKAHRGVTAEADANAQPPDVADSDPDGKSAIRDDAPAEGNAEGSGEESGSGEVIKGAEDEGEGDSKTPDPQTDEKSQDAADSSFDDPFAGLEDVATMDLYELANYTFGKKNQESKSRIMQRMTDDERATELEKRYMERGMRRSVGAVILVHSHNFPYILLLQRSDGKGQYALPGGRLRPGENDEEGLQRKLISKLRPSDPVSGDDEEQQELDIGDKLCVWRAIDFSGKYYPYVPAHVTKPKETLNVYTVSLPSKFMFAVPHNLQLLAVPLFEVYNNPSTYGDVICSIPSLLSRYHINYC